MYMYTMLISTNHIYISSGSLKYITQLVYIHSVYTDFLYNTVQSETMIK